MGLPIGRSNGLPEPRLDARECWQRPDSLHGSPPADPERRHCLWRLAFGQRRGQAPDDFSPGRLGGPATPVDGLALEVRGGEPRCQVVAPAFGVDRDDFEICAARVEGEQPEDFFVAGDLEQRRPPAGAVVELGEDALDQRMSGGEEVDRLVVDAPKGLCIRERPPVAVTLR